MLQMTKNKLTIYLFDNATLGNIWKDISIRFNEIWSQNNEDLQELQIR